MYVDPSYCVTWHSFSVFTLFSLCTSVWIFSSNISTSSQISCALSSQPINPSTGRPGRCRSNANLAMKRVTQMFWFPGAHKVMFTTHFSPATFNLFIHFYFELKWFYWLFSGFWCIKRDSCFCFQNLPVLGLWLMFSADLPPGELFEEKHTQRRRGPGAKSRVSVKSGVIVATAGKLSFPQNCLKWEKCDAGWGTWPLGSPCSQAAAILKMELKSAFYKSLSSSFGDCVRGSRKTRVIHCSLSPLRTVHW